MKWFVHVASAFSSPAIFASYSLERNPTRWSGATRPSTAGMVVGPEIAKPVPQRYQLNVRLGNSMVFQGYWIFPAVFGRKATPKSGSNVLRTTWRIIPV
jgi:hypothetical protein